LAGITGIKGLTVWIRITHKRNITIKQLFMSGLNRCSSCITGEAIPVLVEHVSAMNHEWRSEDNRPINKDTEWKLGICWSWCGLIMQADEKGQYFIYQGDCLNHFDVISQLSQWRLLVKYVTIYTEPIRDDYFFQ